ncbi:MAG: TRAP transporter small permease subunit, partial [Beijerinckiaceae bacterium]
MKSLQGLAETIFGIAFVVLGLAVALETSMRKMFNTSLQGVDELGGYILAGGAALAMAAALMARAHIRIDLVHDHLPRPVRLALNIVSAAALAVCAVMLSRMAWIAMSESKLFNATAQTPWATPLVYPQAIWVATLSLFALLAIVQGVRAVHMLMRGDAATVDRLYGPRGA